MCLVECSERNIIHDEYKKDEKKTTDEAACWRESNDAPSGRSGDITLTEVSLSGFLCE